MKKIFFATMFVLVAINLEDARVGEVNYIEINEKIQDPESIECFWCYG